MKKLVFFLYFLANKTNKNVRKIHLHIFFIFLAIQTDHYVILKLKKKYPQKGRNIRTDYYNESVSLMFDDKLP